MSFFFFSTFTGKEERNLGDKVSEDDMLTFLPSSPLIRVHYFS